MSNLTVTYKISVILALIFVLWGAFFPEYLGNIMTVAQSFF
jgi:glycine betaine transporter